MMLLIFATMLLAFCLSWAGHDGLAGAAILCGFVLSVGEFLWLIHNADYGFRMPWIQVQLMLPGAGG